MLDSTSSVTWSRNIVIDLQLPEMHSGRRQSRKASGSEKNKRKLDFWCVSPGQICIFMYNPELEYRGVVQVRCTFVCTCTSNMFLIHVHWQAIDRGLIFLYYNFHGIKKHFISRVLRYSWFSLLSVIIHVWWRMFLCVMFPIFYIFYNCMEISVINLRTMHNYNKLRNDKNVHSLPFLII